MVELVAEDEDDDSVPGQVLARQCMAEALDRLGGDVWDSVPRHEVALTRQCLGEAFRKLDPMGHGTVDRHAFVRILRALLATWADDDVDAMLAASGAAPGSPAPEGGGIDQRVDYEAFADWFFALSRPASAGGVGFTSPDEIAVAGLGGAAVGDSPAVVPAGCVAGAEGPLADTALALGDTEAITAEQLSVALNNMAKAWETAPSGTRLPREAARSLFDDRNSCSKMCDEMLQRWHSGRSSHPDRERLATIYPYSEGLNRLISDVLALQGAPDVQAADRRLHLAKLAVVEADSAVALAPAGGAAGAGEAPAPPRPPRRQLSPRRDEESRSATAGRTMSPGGALSRIDHALGGLVQDLDGFIGSGGDISYRAARAAASAAPKRPVSPFRRDAPPEARPQPGGGTTLPTTPRRESSSAKQDAAMVAPPALGSDLEGTDATQVNEPNVFRAREPIAPQETRKPSGDSPPDMTQQRMGTSQRAGVQERGKELGTGPSIVNPITTCGVPPKGSGRAAPVDPSSGKDLLEELFNEPEECWAKRLREVSSEELACVMQLLGCPAAGHLGILLRERTEAPTGGVLPRAA
jgi:hypothetical protein